MLRGLGASIRPMLQLCEGRTVHTAAARRMSRIVDVWTNPPEHDLLDGVPEVASLMVKSGAQLPPKSMKFGPDEVVSMMDGAGIQICFITAWTRHGKTVISNERIAEYTKAYPERFVGIGGVNLAAPMEAVKEAERCIRDYGFKGIRVLPWLWNLAPTTNVYYPLFSKLSELGAAFLTQVGHTGPMCPSDPGRPIPYIDQVALHFPDLTIIGGHIGYPWTEEMISLAWKYPNVYIDTSAHLPKYYPKELLAFMDSRGSDKVMFGSNFPMLGFDKCVEQATQLNLKPDTMEKFMWRNADRVFNLGLGEEAKAKL